MFITSAFQSVLALRLRLPAVCVQAQRAYSKPTVREYRIHPASSR